MSEMKRSAPESISVGTARLCWVLTGYFMLSLVWLKYYHWSISPDSISYISIAQKYCAGDFHHAVNGDWSPLVSWLLVPFLWLDLDPLLAFHLLSPFIGTITLVGVMRLSFRFPMTERIRTSIFITLIPMLISFHYSQPDLLLTGILVYYFYIIWDTDYACGKSDGLRCGVLGGLAFLSKTYALPFFLSHFMVCNALHYFRIRGKAEKKNLLKNCVSGLAAFCVICAIWLGMLGIKYGEFTLGTAASGSHAQLNPVLPNASFHYRGLAPPPNETAVSAWEDAYFVSANYWNPFESWKNLKHQATVAIQAAGKTARIGILFSPLSVTIIIIYLFLIPVHRRSTGQVILCPLITVFIYASGYVLIGIVTDRYLWPVSILLLLVGGHCIHAVFKSSFFNARRKNIVLILFCLSFMTMPTRFLLENANDGKAIHEISQILTNRYHISGKIASNGKWHETMYLSYHLGSRYYGTKEPGMSGDRLREALRKYPIDHYFVWNDAIDGCEPLPQFLQNRRAITDPHFPKLTIYLLTGGK